MKRTILTRSQLDLLEEALLRYGKVVSIHALHGLLADKSPGYRSALIKRLADAGWLVWIKRGTYQIADLSSLGTLSLSRYTIAQILWANSYVSFESALQFWGMYDQLLGTVTSVALQQYGPATVEHTQYHYVKTSAAHFYGWDVVEIDQRQVRMACPEKALIDMVQFHRSPLSVSVVVETLTEYGHRIDFARLTQLLMRTNLTTQRIWGHLLDQMGTNTDGLWVRSSDSTSVSRLTLASQSYDPKWRLYHDPILSKLGTVR